MGDITLRIKLLTHVDEFMVTSFGSAPSSPVHWEKRGFLLSQEGTLWALLGERTLRDFHQHPLQEHHQAALGCPNGTNVSVGLTVFKGM